MRWSRRAFVAGALAASVARPAFAQSAPNRFLVESATLAAGSIAARHDAARGYQPYFHLDLGSSPPEGLHSSWDYADTAGRFVAAFTRLRAMGIAVDSAAEAGVRQFLLGNQASTGLFVDQAGQWADGWAETFAQSRAMLGLVEWFLASGSATVETRIQAQLRGLEAIVVPAGDGVVFPGKQYRDGWLDADLTAAAADQTPKPGYGALVAEPILRYVAVAGDPRALAFAETLIAGFLATATLRPDGVYQGHTHSWGMVPMAISLALHGALTGREDRLALARAMYDFTVAQATGWGWLPDGIGFGPGYPGALTCETCGLADLIRLGITLARFGHEKAWGDVERFSQNQFIQNQFRTVNGIISPEDAAASQTNAAAMLLGSFEAWARPNSLLGGFAFVENGGLEACCTGSAVMALDMIGSAVLERRDGTLWVNLPFTARTSFGSIESYLPSEGRIVVTSSLPSVVIRLPEGVATATVSGATTERQNGLLVLQAVPNQPIEIRFPVAERSETRRVADLTVTVRWRGNHVVALDPPGDRYPIFTG